jgi:hypothetical protein
MPRSILLRLVDIRDAIRGIQKVTDGAAFDGFANNWGHAACRRARTEIISEASRHIPDDKKAIIEEHRPPLAVAIEQLIIGQERYECGEAIAGVCGPSAQSGRGDLTALQAVWRCRDRQGEPGTGPRLAKMAGTPRSAKRGIESEVKSYYCLGQPHRRATRHARNPSISR